MNAHASRAPALLAIALACAGCVDRRISITSEPTGAIVYLNDTEVGRTPVEVNFTYFGTYDVRLNLQGYEPLITSAEAKPPLHEQPGIDFVALFVPGWKTTRIDWHFDLEPESVTIDDLVQRAEELRAAAESPAPDNATTDDN